LATTKYTENKRGKFVGATIMVLIQIVMATIMTMTPVHMKHHGHGLGAVGLVIGFHIGAMPCISLHWIQLSLLISWDVLRWLLLIELRCFLQV
jgi:hypothetical protein